MYKNPKYLLALAFAAATPFQSAGAQTPLAAPTKLSTSAKAQDVVAAPKTWRYQNEEHWLVDSIGRDIAEILVYAKLHDQPEPKFDAKQFEFKTSIVDKAKETYLFKAHYPATKLDDTYQLSLTEYIWSTKNYQPFAKKLIDSMQLTPHAVAEPPTDFLKELADNDMTGLIAMNERLSKKLATNPLDAGLHEQAAMLQAKFNIEEIAGDFTEDRPQLSRGCAHLSIARALNDGKLGAIGELAETALELMSVRDGMVLDRLDSIEKNSTDAATKSWVRALRMRATSDCRAYNDADHTGVEESQYTLRASNDGNVTSLLELAAKHHKVMPIALLRILANNNGSVEVGHMLASHIVQIEMKSLHDDYLAYKKIEPPSPAITFKELNLTSNRCLNVAEDGTPTLNIISWDDVAAFHCRHLLSATVIEYNFNQYKFGVPELAKATIEQTKTVFADVYMKPFALSEFLLEKADRDEALKGGLIVLNNTPELLTSDLWHMISIQSKEASPDLARGVPKAETWFDPAMPMGTDYEFYSRHQMSNCKMDLASLTQMRAYCPFMYELDYHWAQEKYGKHPNSDQYREAFGKMVEYSSMAMRAVARGAIGEPQKFIEIEEKICAAQPVEYFGLAAYCVLHNMPEQAAKYYEAGVAKSTDAVLTSNSVGWLISYRYEHGQKDKAKELAEYCGEIYSAVGLENLARFDEQCGDLQGAEKTYRDLAERYDNRTYLAAFLTRNAAKNKSYATEGEELVKKIFPNGMKKVTLEQFVGTAPPKKGVLVTDGDLYSPLSPLLKNTVIVAINNYAVDTQAQFNVARHLPHGKDLTVIIWDGKKYIETKKQVVNNDYLRISVSNFSGEYLKD